MGITKREIAAELGVSKRTIANYIGKLGLGNHVSRNGNTDILRLEQCKITLPLTYVL